nr:DUF2188 domain-containing protein [uncultured Cupriavidus sp.]
MAHACIHVLRIEGVQWIVEGPHGVKDRHYFPNRSEAIAAGVAFAIQHRTELVVHTRDGRVSRRRSFPESLA